jgi:hypothetical protein
MKYVLEYTGNLQFKEEKTFGWCIVWIFQQGGTFFICIFSFYFDFFFVMVIFLVTSLLLRFLWTYFPFFLLYRL